MRPGHTRLGQNWANFQNVCRQKSGTVLENRKSGGRVFQTRAISTRNAGQSAPELFRSRLWVTISIAFRGDFWGIRSKTGISLGVHHSRDVREATGAYSTRQSWTSRDRLEPWSVRVSTPLDPQTTTSGSVTALLGHTRQKSAKIPLLLVLLFEYDFWFFFSGFRTRSRSSRPTETFLGNGGFYISCLQSIYAGWCYMRSTRWGNTVYVCVLARGTRIE